MTDANRLFGIPPAYIETFRSLETTPLSSTYILTLSNSQLSFGGVNDCAHQVF